MIRRWFGKRQASSRPDPDRMTLDLLMSDWQCACCGEWHHGLMDLAARAPDPWPHAKDYEPNSALRTDGDFLSEDFCVIDGRHFFIRSLIEIPVRGLDQPWGFGCWNTLSWPNFDKYVAGFDDGEFDGDGWFGWLCNQLKIYFEESQPIAVDVFPQPGRQRPRLMVQDADHPLGRAQREGISPDDLLALLRAYGHGPTLQ